MTKYIYRFRSTRVALHERQELATQEIHLASPKILNDPMEGYKDVFWQGDPILWRNLLRHYLLCLLRAYEECLWMAGDTFKEPTIYGALTEENLPTEGFRSLFREAVEVFFSERRVLRWVEILSQWTEPVSKEQLLFHLSQAHPFAIQAVNAAFIKQGYSVGTAPHLPPEGGLNLEPLLNLNVDRRASLMNPIWEAGAEIISQQNLSLIYNQRTRSPAQTSEKRDWLVLHFPRLYIDALVESLIHPPWYTASFSSSCDNASMWSTYGDHHRGIALMFRTEEDPAGNISLPLDGVMGSSFVAGKNPESTPVFARSLHRLHPVNYSTGAPRVDFFRYVGQLPHPVVLRTWWCDENNNISPRLSDIGHDMEKWRSELWSFFDECAVRKLPDWDHEQEYRIVVPDLLGLRAQYPNLKYDFGSLAGIVFGMRTSADDKLAAMRIIEPKCRASEKPDFQFFQARYSSTAGRLIISPMNLLKFARDAKENPSGPGE